MQKLIKSIISLLISIILGSICGYLVFSIYKPDDIIYMIESNEYSNMTDMKVDNTTDNYSYYTSNNKYYKVLGFTKDKSNIDKINNIYSDIKLVECTTIDNNFSNLISINDKKIDTATDTEIKDILNDSINYYENNNINIYKINKS